jgi:aromatic ring-cleaving dioxygenase
MYHAHVYFDLSQESLATRLHHAITTDRDDILRIYPLVTRKVGPHDKPMFEVHFNDNRQGFINWLDQHREGLSVLIHPNTSNELQDHTDSAVWLGEELPIHVDTFK